MPRIRDLQHEVEHFVTTQRKAYPLSEQMRVLFFRLRFVPNRTYEGTIEDVRHFVTWFKRIINAEDQKERRQDRLEALELVESELLGHSFSSAFPLVKLPKFIFQLVLRIREPKLIDQADTGFCGIVPLIVEMAKRRPTEYVHLADSLIKNGRAKVGRIDIDLHPDVLKEGPRDGLGECDYVIFTGVRNSALIFRGTSPGITISEMCNYLGHAGYVHIENHLFSTKNKELERYYPEGATVERILKNMAEKAAARQIIVMIEDAQISAALRYGTPIADEFVGCHYSCVTRFKVNWKTRTVDLKVCNWGGSDKRNNIPIADLEPHFGGFISCTERFVRRGGIRGSFKERL